MDLPVLVVASSIFLMILLLKHYYSAVLESIWHPQALPYPPGPKPIPLLGNLFDMPERKPWLTYTKWRQQYGDLNHIYIPGNGHYIIINSLEVALELLEKRAAIYSDRVFTFIDELCGFDVDLAFGRYSEQWRKYRKTFQESWRPSVALYFKPVQYRIVHSLLNYLVDSPTDFMAHALALSQGLIFTGVYGLEGSSQEVPARIARAVADAMGLSFKPGSHILPKLFPFLRYLPSWMPGCQFKLFAKNCSRMVKELKDVAFDLALERMDTGIPSLVGELVSKNKDDPEEISRIKNMAATSYIAAADTMTSAIESFFLAMTLNPDVQKKAQEEIDRVISTDRLPNLEDRLSLPYIEAIYREVMRWNPAAPLGVPHKTSESDIYNGNYIPEGAIVISNIWAMTHDASIFDDPQDFKPERFLTGSPDAPFTSINDILTFGFGRRICVGRYVADPTVWLSIACILATFNISKAKDVHGNEIEVPGHMTEQFFSRPKPFRCSITPRSVRAEMLIKGTQ